MDVKPVNGGACNGSSSGLSEQKSGFWIDVQKNNLRRGAAGVRLLDDPREFLVDERQPLAKIAPGYVDAASCDELKGAGGCVDDAVSGVVQAGVDAKNAKGVRHGKMQGVKAEQRRIVPKWKSENAHAGSMPARVQWLT